MENKILLDELELAVDNLYEELGISAQVPIVMYYILVHNFKLSEWGEIYLIR